LAAVIFIVFGKPLLSFVAPWLQDFLLPLIAFGGGLTATLMVYSLSQQYGKTHVALLILAGVAIIALSQAFVGLSVFSADENLARAYSFWTLGELGGATCTKILLAMPLIVIPCTSLVSRSHALKAMAVGETDAFDMGDNVERMKMTIII